MEGCSARADGLMFMPCYLPLKDQVADAGKGRVSPRFTSTEARVSNADLTLPDDVSASSPTTLQIDKRGDRVER